MLTFAFVLRFVVLAAQPDYLFWKAVVAVVRFYLLGSADDARQRKKVVTLVPVIIYPRACFGYERSVLTHFHQEILSESEHAVKVTQHAVTEGILLFSLESLHNRIEAKT